MTVETLKLVAVETQFAVEYMRPIEEMSEDAFASIGRRLYRRALATKERVDAQPERVYSGIEEPQTTHRQGGNECQEQR